MKCPHCSEDNDRVIDSRSSAEGAEIRRRRECLECSRRYTTYEKVKTTPLLVVKKDDSRMPYIRQKLMEGLVRACHKRPVPVDVLENICNRVEQRISQEHDREVPTEAIGEMVMAELRKTDLVAYVRFASVYRAFNDITEFLDELRPMLGELSTSEHGQDPVDPEAG
ncbi:MAG: transcriptional regulator NrdR [Planctomycetota bacterium]|nr:transcriptional regulator NrdR [Planctomycetota bacterium]